MTTRLLARLGPDGRQPHLLDHFPECGTWSVTPYGRCDLRCTYCITRVQGASMPRFVEPELTTRLASELASVDPDATLSLGALCDAYPQAERVHGVTRVVLSELMARGRQLVIITKGATILRDLDLLARYQAVRVDISLCSVDEAALHRVDPAAPSAAERLAMVHALADAGVRVAISAAPWIPWVTDAAALIGRVRRGVTVHFAPLNVRKIADTPFGRRYDQEAVNRAYLEDLERVGPQPDVHWRPPVPLTDEGAQPHPLMTINLVGEGHRELGWQPVGIR